MTKKGQRRKSGKKREEKVRVSHFNSASKVCVIRSGLSLTQNPSTVFMLPLVPVKQSDPEPIDQGMWLKLEQVKFKDRNGTERTWERCVRAGSRGSSQVDGKSWGVPHCG